MRALAVLITAAFAPALSAAAVAAPAARAASATPLAVLGGVLSGALAAPAAGPVFPALSAPPAAWARVKAEALLARAATLPGGPTPAPAAASPADALRLLEAVNATLKAVPAERLRSMPVEEAQGLAAAVMDGAGLGGGQASLEGVSALSRESLARVKSALGAPTRETLLNPGHPESHPDAISVRGVPPGVREISSEGRVFRHYTTAEGLAAILSQGSLWNGFLPYVQTAPGVYRKDFLDLTGVFLTGRGVPGHAVGVPASEYPFWVDIVLPPSLPLLELEKGSIFLVPLPARTRAWVADLYRRWTRGEILKPYEMDMIERLDAEGGPGPELSVPVTVVGHGRAS